MRALASMVLVVTVVGCKAKDTGADSTVADTAAGAAAPAPAAPAAAAPGARYAGRWAVTGYMGNDKKPQRFAVIADSSGSSIAVAGNDTVRYHQVSMSDTGFVLESAPYTDRQSKTEVVDHVEGRMVGDSMVGTVETRPTKGGAPMKGRWTAHRATP